MDVLVGLYDSCGCAWILFPIWIRHDLYECAREGELWNLWFYLVAFELKKSVLAWIVKPHILHSGCNCVNPIPWQNLALDEIN